MPDGNSQEIVVEDPVVPALEAKPGQPQAQPDDARLKAMENLLAGNRRVTEKLERQLAQIAQALNRTQTTTPAPAQPPPSTPATMPSGAQAMPAGTAQATIDQYDALVQKGDWQTAVRLLAREEYKSARTEEVHAQTIQQTDSQRLSAFERSKQKVIDAFPQLHPETGDPSTVESQLYNQAISQLSSEDPYFLKDPYAPVLALDRMKELATQQNVKLTSPLDITTGRRGSVRAGPTSAPVSRGIGGPAPLTVTPEQKEWLAMHPEVKADQYAKISRSLEHIGGIES